MFIDLYLLRKPGSAVFIGHSGRCAAPIRNPPLPSFRTVRSTDPESRQEISHRWQRTAWSLDSGSRSPGSRPGSLGRNDKVGVISEARVAYHLGHPGSPRSTPPSVIPEARAAGYPGSRKNIDQRGKDQRGFWIPARAPRQKPGRLAGMTGEKAITAVVPAEAKRRAGTSQRQPMRRETAASLSRSRVPRHARFRDDRKS